MPATDRPSLCRQNGRVLLGAGEENQEAQRLALFSNICVVAGEPGGAMKEAAQKELDELEQQHEAAALERRLLRSIFAASDPCAG